VSLLAVPHRPLQFKKLFFDDLALDNSDNLLAHVDFSRLETLAVRGCSDPENLIASLDRAAQRRTLGEHMIELLLPDRRLSAKHGLTVNSCQDAQNLCDRGLVNPLRLQFGRSTQVEHS